METLESYKKQAERATDELLNEMIMEIKADITLLESFYRSGSKHYYFSVKFCNESVIERDRLCKISSVLLEEKSHRITSKKQL